MGEVLLRFGLPADADRATLQAYALHYLAAICYADDRDAYQRFVAAVVGAHRSAKARRACSREDRRAIERAARVLSEKRLPAAMMANQLCQKLTARLTRGKALRVSVADDLSLNKLIDATAEGRTRHKSRANFLHHCWQPSKPVLHMAIGLKHHGRSGSIERLVSEPDWLPLAMKNAQFHAVLIRKAIPDIGRQVEIVLPERSINAQLASMKLPSLVAERGVTDPIARALLAWR